jgi:hypothetical protein
MLNIFSENNAVSEIMWKNMVQTDRPHMTVYSCVERMLF